MRSSTRQGQRGLEVAKLRGRQFVIEENQIRLGGGRNAGNLFHFAGANQRGRIGLGAPLQNFGNYLAARAGHQLAKLGERFFRIKTGATAAPRTSAPPLQIRLRGGARRAITASGI